MIETREVFRGRLGDWGLPSPFCSSSAGLGPSPAPPDGRPARKIPLPLPLPSSLPQPLALGRWGGGCAGQRELSQDSEVSQAVLKQESLSSVLSLHFKRGKKIEGFWGESEWAPGTGLLSSRIAWRKEAGGFRWVIERGLWGGAVMQRRRLLPNSCGFLR